MWATRPGVTYSYDGDGRRAAKVGSKLYWYGSGGEILAETNASGATTAEYIFFGGKRIAMLPAGFNPQYYVEDFLGTSRVVTQNNGSVCYDADFPPYGQERAYTNSCSQNAYKFEGKERDAETQNDEFGARYYSWRFGRWLSADWSAVPVPVPYANLTNPQTLNLYAMVADDPESFADLDGHLAFPGAPCTVQGCKQAGEDDQNKAKAAQETKQVTAQKQQDSTTPPSPLTPDPAGTRTDPALNPSNSNSSATNSPADQTQAPLESRAHGKGERGTTSKPEFKDKPGKLPKGVRPNPDKPGQYQVKDPHTGNWVDKQPGWSPYAQRVAIGAAIVTGAVITGHAIAGCFASGACELGLALAF
jgi:RHS repeat-associated protein